MHIFMHVTESEKEMRGRVCVRNLEATGQKQRRQLGRE